MKVSFNKIILHNFISFSHSEVALNNRDYCLVSGVNNCPLDNTVSNGSGKSSIWSAITYALTGETISGLKDVKNKFVDEKSCYVSLEFTVDGDDYVVTRIKEPKSDLKISVNGEDKSGKGVKESSVILAQYLPDLTFDLISSVILIGQGMPNKLSGKSPSGRKELLEKLSKSDFMIEDVKKRITERSNHLYAKQRTIEDSTLRNTTQQSSLNLQLSRVDANISSLIVPDENEVKELDNLIAEALASKDAKETELNSLESELDGLNNILNESLNKLNNSKQEKYKQYTETINDLNSKLNEVNSEYSVNYKEFNRLSSITDVCPTCGQKLIGVEKPDTTELQNKLNTLKESQLELQNKLRDERNKYESANRELDNNYNVEMSSKNADVTNVKNKINTIRYDINKLNDNITNLKIKLTTVQNNINTYEQTKLNLEQEKIRLQSELDEVANNIESLQSDKVKVQDHIDIIKKFDTLVKRDFRGYLLQNIISYIDNKAKEYCPIVFGSNQISFALDGNDINISYCGKEYEGLSGGEKQKVDLIIQFALRDLMCKYLGFSSNILILDEIFDNLDAQGTNNVINLISNCLNDIESVFIISHHSDELQINYDTTLQVVKNVNGISEVK